MESCFLTIFFFFAFVILTQIGLGRLLIITFLSERADYITVNKRQQTDLRLKFELLYILNRVRVLNLLPEQ